MLKRLRKSLKSFPDNGSGLIQKEIANEIKEIKTAVKEMVAEPQTSFIEEKQEVVLDGNRLLGELLGYLRTNKLMSVLMICRQIAKIEIESAEAVIYPSDTDDISNNEQVREELKKFFNGKGLSFRMYKEKKQRDPIEELNAMLGGKLKVE